jgi:HD-GYP domain-containing protein (c-di-GMP phosphodiesterase class II)
MKKSKKIGYVDVSANILDRIKMKNSNIIFYDVRESKHKLFDIVLYSDNLPIEIKTFFEMFNVLLINVTNSTIDNICENITNGYKRHRYLNSDQIHYINVINKFLYLNDKIEKLVGGEESHSFKVAYILKRFCNKINMSEDRTLELYIAGLFHDIGKIYVNPKILCKKGKLTKEEYDEIKIHPIKSYEMLKGYLPESTLLLIKNHHKRENNNGYPMDNEEFSEWSEILALSDSFDAMTSKRIYNIPLSKTESINELELCSKETDEGGKGILFNPYLTELFVKTL